MAHCSAIEKLKKAWGFLKVQLLSVLMKFQNKKKSLTITTRILVALVAGLAVGVALNGFDLQAYPFLKRWLVSGVFELGGQIFVRLLQMLVVPVVFLSLVCGSAGLEDVKKLGRMGVKALVLFLGTTLLAVGIGMVLAFFINPGRGFNLSGSSAFKPQEVPGVFENLIALVPRNPIESFAKADMLPIIIFSLFVGIAITLSGEAGKRTLTVFRDLEKIMMKIVDMVIAVSPFGVFCLIAKVAALQGIEAISPLFKYFMTVLLALLVQVALVYPALLKGLSGLSPFIFFRKFYEVMFFAFSTSSSNATIPVNLEVVEKRLGVKNSVASFIIPLGATVNMDGTAIMQGVATVFIAQAYGIDFGLKQSLLVMVTALLASIGTAGVPGVGLVMLAMVFQQVGLPVEAIGVIMAVDRPLDMARTAVNITGDAVVSCIVAKSEKQWDETVFLNS